MHFSRFAQIKITYHFTPFGADGTIASMTAAQ
jgi:hypothetical protein